MVCLALRYGQDRDFQSLLNYTILVQKCKYIPSQSHRSGNTDETCITILRGWYRAQKPLNPGNTKKLRKKIQNPPPRVGPRKYEKNTEKIRKWWAIFVFFRYFFRIFEGQPGVGDFVFFFFVFFSYFRGSWALYHPRRIATLVHQVLRFILAFARHRSSQHFGDPSFLILCSRSLALSFLLAMVRARSGKLTWSSSKELKNRG